MSKQPSAIAALFLQEESRLKRIVRRITGCAFLAEDVVQDTFVNLAKHDLTAQDRGFLVQSAKNLAIDRIRQDRRRRDALAALRPEQVATAPPSQETACADREAMQDFLAALRGLPERTQRAFLLSKLDGLSYAEIADRLGVSVSTVEKDLMSALLFCRDWRRNRDLF
ncbi:RNA polymerase sigma factor [Aureimonas flava]|uniref:RNA polymerase sigma factor n=1 Tax=Aureimonas flava TaxID=2320271 RepID=A0A3A1WJ96_9HYPH|nr:RNA polymerase sigma factor [Aureimonas flava]RIY01064.1 RNA polymerase sigma factor [Aureimonas flava]